MNRERVRSRLYYCRALRDSLTASAVGYVIGFLFTEIFVLTPLGRLIDELLSWKLVLFFSAVGSIVGWCVFLLPLSKRYRSSTWMINYGMMSGIACVLGLVIAGVETYPLRFYTHSLFSMRNLYIASGVLNACSATLCLLWLKRRPSSRP